MEFNKLEKLNLSWNKISNFNELKELDLWPNNITDIKVLEKIKSKFKNIKLYI